MPDLMGEGKGEGVGRGFAPEVTTVVKMGLLMGINGLCVGVRDLVRGCGCGRRGLARPLTMKGELPVGRASDRHLFHAVTVPG